MIKPLGQLPTQIACRLEAVIGAASGGSSGTARLRTTVKPCVACDGSEAYVVATKVIPDFDPAVLPPALREAFLTKQNGYCALCGLFQDFNRLSAADFRALNALGKDVLTTDPAYHIYPPPPEAVTQFDRAHYGKRLDRWRDYFAARRAAPKEVLFIRSWFGAGPRFAAEAFGARVSGLDMSETCLRYVADTLPGFRALEGETNGLLEGPFLETGPYDAVFVFHVLTHAADAPAMLRQINGLLRPGGFAVFTNEIERKPQNPFHNLHLSEPQLVTLLRAEFARVERIDDCEDSYVPHASPYTLKGDIPDFAAWTEPGGTA